MSIVDARYYPMARTAHLERLRSMHPAEFLYTRHRLDWDAELAERMPGVLRVTYPQLLARVWRRPYRCVEVPEPLAIVLLPQVLGLALALKIKRVLKPRASRTYLVFYAIENLDQVGKLRSRVPLPRIILQAMLNVATAPILAETRRAAFGTQGALDTLRKQIGEKRWRRFTSRSEVQLILGLPRAQDTRISKDRDLVCFLGSFEARKGIDLVLDAWRTLKMRRPGTRMVIMGHGELTEKVVEFAEREGVELRIDPPRDHIRSTLERSHCLVLPSQRTPVWREQIGLPILEALESGCEIVTTTETGIADWLDSTGHRVLGPDAGAVALAAAIADALDERRAPEDIMASLPAVDGRVAADNWLFGRIGTIGDTQRRREDFA